MDEKSRFLDALSFNSTRILKLIWKQRGVSRIEIAHRLDVDKSTVSKLVGELMERGLVEECAEGETSPLGGRKPVHLAILPGWGCSVGVELQPERVITSVLDLNGTPLIEESSEAEFAGGTVAALRKALDKAVRRARKAGLSVLGAGVGLPGIIDPGAGIVHRSYPLDIAEPLEVARPLSEALDLDVSVEKDAFCCCWPELLSGKARSNALYLLGEFRQIHTAEKGRMGIGVGFGLLLDGRVHHGSDFSAGEFMSILRARDRPSQFSADWEVVSAARDDPARFAEIARELALNVAMLVNTLNLTRVVVCGGFARHADILLAEVAAAIRRNWSYETEVACELAVSEFGESTVAQGAAVMEMSRLLTHSQDALTV